MAEKKQADQFIDEVFRAPDLDWQRSLLEQSWYRNILYYLGEQWLNWLAETSTFGRRFEFMSSIPTPVSNIIRDYVRAMKALVLNKRYTVKVWPNSNDKQDKDGATLGEQLMNDLDASDDYEIEDTKEDVVLWNLMTGNGFTRVYPGFDTGLLLPNGARTGKVMCDSLLPFNIIVSDIGRALEQKAWVGIKSLRLKEWIEDTYQKQVQTADFENGRVEYEKQLLKLIANVSPWKGRGMESEYDISVNDAYCMVKEIEMRPCKAYPQGRYILAAGNTILRDEPSMPIPVDKQGRWYYTITHFPYNNTPGSFWATSGIDDLISPQNIINEVDQSLAVNRKTLGRPFLLTPSQVILKRLTAKGQGLLAIQYDARLSGGAKPEVVQGTPMPQQVLAERAIHSEVAQMAAGDPKNILRGQQPSAGASGVMVDVLREAAEMSHAPDIARFYRNWGKTQRKRLVVAQTLYTEQRMIKVQGAGKSVYVKAFKGADLRDNTDVRLELESMLSSTNAGRNDLMVKLIGNKFFGELAMKPKLQREIASRLGLSNLPSEENVHYDKAEYENSLVAYGDPDDMSRVSLPNMPIADPETGEMAMDPETDEPMALFPESYDPSFRFDNHMIHLMVHEEFILSPQFRDLDPKRQQLAIAHRDLHEGAIKAMIEEKRKQLTEDAANGLEQQGGGPVDIAAMAQPNMNRALGGAPPASNSQPGGI